MATESGPMGQQPAAGEYGRTAILSDIGHMRETNEDSALLVCQERVSAQGAQSLVLLLLADGMGGQEGGERASLLAIQAAGECLIDEVLRPLAAPASDVAGGISVREALVEAFERAQELVLREVEGGGTTLTAAVIMGRRIHVGHVGDCRLYLLHDGSLTALTRDHSMLARLQELGQIGELDAEALAQDPRRNSLYRAVGQPADLEVDLFSRVLAPGDGLLLCSDGLWGSVPEPALVQIITDAPSPVVACRRLIDAANAAGGPDNITALLLYPLA